MTNLYLREFTYVNKRLTTVILKSEIWFVAPEVCEFLEIRNVSDAIQTLEPDEKLVSAIPRAGQKRSVNLVNESGLYNLIFKSRKEGARRFRKWVTSEVLPAIRKDGYYGYMDGTGLPNFVTRYKENCYKIANGYFSIISELFITLYLEMEKNGFIIPERADDGKIIMPDISVGMAFSNYLKTIQSPFVDKHKYYKHTLYRGRDVDARQYSNEVLADFRHFVYNVWLVKHAERYFQERAPQALPYLQKLLKAS
jgi:prophage antirepressor-like protein